MMVEKFWGGGELISRNNLGIKRRTVFGVCVPWGKLDGAHVSEYPWSCARHPGDYHSFTNLGERERETWFENKINETML